MARAVGPWRWCHLLLCIRHQEEGALGSLRTSPGYTVVAAEMDANLTTQPPPHYRYEVPGVFCTRPCVGKLVTWGSPGPGHLVQ